MTGQNPLVPGLPLPRQNPLHRKGDPPTHRKTDVSTVLLPGPPLASLWWSLQTVADMPQPDGFRLSPPRHLRVGSSLLCDPAAFRGVGGRESGR